MAGLWRRAAAEGLAAFALVFAGCGAIVADARYDGALGAVGVALVFGLVIMAMVYATGHLSGAHINPAVTIALAAFRGFPWTKVPHYIFAQVAGAFTGAALVYLNYKDAIKGYENATEAVRGETSSIASYSIFATFPAGFFHNEVGPFIDELIGTALLVGIVLAVIDNLNLPPKGNLAPWIIGLVVAGVGMSYGANTGYAINPARDFGPRLLAWAAGWGDIAMPGNYGNVDWYFWIPIVAPIVGGIIGALVYDFFISHVLRARGEPPTPEVETRGEVVEEL